MLKRILSLVCTALLCCFMPPSALARAGLPRVGVLIYNGNDTFIMSLLDQMHKRAEHTAELHIFNAANDQNTQMQQLKDLLDDSMDAMIVNAVDRSSALFMIRLCKQKNVPVVFINREPYKEDILTYDRAYYVGTQPYQQGLMSGELLADYFLTHPESDKNGDGRLQYVLIKGEAGHQDTEHRSIASAHALEVRGARPDKLAEQSGNWEKGRGQQIMAAFLARFGDRIEGVLCNNDDMALGAIDALKAAGYFSDGAFVPVVSVDATLPAQEALLSGTLLGTVHNDAACQGRIALEVALLLLGNRPVTDLPYPPVDERFIFIPSVKITKEDLPLT